MICKLSRLSNAYVNTYFWGGGLNVLETSPFTLKFLLIVNISNNRYPENVTAIRTR